MNDRGRPGTLRLLRKKLYDAGCPLASRKKRVLSDLLELIMPTEEVNSVQ